MKTQSLYLESFCSSVDGAAEEKKDNKMVESITSSYVTMPRKVFWFSVDGVAGVS